MRNIKLHYRMAGIAVSVILSAALCGTYLYVGYPEKPKVQDIPIINFDTAGIEVTAQETLVIKDSPFGNLPVALEMPDMPSPPSVPDMSDAAVSDKLVVMGVLPPDVVIIGKGGKTLTARAGENTEFGYIGSISSDGAYIDGAWIALK